MPTLNSTDALPAGANFEIERTAQGVILKFPALRTPGVALGLLAFALVCGLMPALGLSALLSLDASNASAMVSFALIGGFAAPFIVACVVFTLLAIYQLANSLRVEIDRDGVRSERRVFGYLTKRRTLARADIIDIDPRISARLQNLFSKTPRYTLIARNAAARGNGVVIADDLAGQSMMLAVRTFLLQQLDKK